MTSSKSSCLNWRLYVIADRDSVHDRSLVHLSECAIKGGADAIQLRDKSGSLAVLKAEALKILPLARRAGVALIINDYVDLAREVGADGVHLGQSDLSIREARRILGKCIIGKSTHSVEQALSAQKEGADYIGVGPIFNTPTKPDARSVGVGLIKETSSSITISRVCIGGIDKTNVPEVIEAGAKCVAVVRAICQAENPESATRALKELISRNLSMCQAFVKLDSV